MTSTAQVELHAERGTRHAFVVVGMHRSGTSAMTRTLSLLGATLPSNLMPPLEFNNEAGFWESQLVANLNDEILQALDSEWDDVFALRPREYLSNFDGVYIGRAVETLEEEFNGSELVVLKDPRISVLSSFWNRALRKAGYTTHYIVMVRNPLEVAESLRARDGFPFEKSLLLWSSYMVAVDRDTRHCQRTFVSYDQLMANWRVVRDKIESDARLPFPRDTAAASIEIDRHLQKRLRHNRATVEDLFSSPNVPDQTKTLYRTFLDACNGADVDCDAVDAIEAELAKIDSLMGPVLADLKSRARTLAKDVGELNQAEAEARNQAESLTQELAIERSAREAEELELRRLIESKSDELAAEHALRQTDAEINLHLASENSQLAGQLAAAQEQAHLRLSELSLTKTELDSAKTELDSVKTELVSIKTQLDSVKTELDSKTSEIAQLTDQVAESQDQARGYLSELNDSRKQLENLERVNADKDRLTKQLEAKNSELGTAVKLNEALIEENRCQMATILDQLQNSEIELAAKKKDVGSITSRLAITDEELRHARGEISILNRAMRDSEGTVTAKERQLRWLRLVNEVVNASTRGWRALLPPTWRRRRQLEALRLRGLFDARAYLQRYSDVVEAGADPLNHYIVHGMVEGRQADISLD
jgi:hypothetical protein